MTVHYKTLLKLILSIFFLIIAFYKINFREITDAIASINICIYLISLIIVFLNSFILAVKFKILMKPSGIYQTVMALFRINLVCRFYAFFLTPAVGQGVIRWHSSTKNQDNRSKFIAVMILERASFLFILCVSVLLLQAAMKSTALGKITHFIYPLAIIGIGIMTAIGVFLFSARINKTMNNLIAFLETKISFTLPKGFSSKSNPFDIYLSHKKIILQCLLIATAWHLFYLLRVYLLCIAVEVPLNFIQMSWMASLVLLLQMMPITLNGIGIRESGYAFLFSLVSVSPGKGVLIGLLFLSQMLIVSGIGGIINLRAQD